ncbi:hypothetical protein [Escherichia coli]|uniref:hypothetical protein n=1 Tax=Escherichia coli TaxID=562 RepID=UPI0033130992
MVAGSTSDGNGSHASTLKSTSYTKSVSWQHYPCRHHEGVYVDEGIDIESAYKYSMKVYKSNEDKSPFCNVREMTDTVQNYYHEYGGNDTCPLCTKHIDD